MIYLSDRMRTGGIVLCGGKSRRMGTPKAWLPFGGERMLQRVVRVLGEAVGPLVVVAAPGQGVPPLPAGVVLVQDSAPGRGPLQGLATGLAALFGHAEVAYVSSCDVPLLQPAFVSYLVDRLGDRDGTVPFGSGFYHPLAGVFRTSILPVVEGLLREGHARLTRLVEDCVIRCIPVEELRCVDPDLRSLYNVNTPEDYQEALDMANGREGG